MSTATGDAARGDWVFWRLVGPLAVALGRAFEAERERWILWLPVAFGVGIAVYFALPSEPSPWLPFLALSLVAVVTAWLRDRPFGWLLGCGLLALVAGFALAQLRTNLVAAPVLAKSTGPTSVLGQVLEIEPRHAGRRVLLRPLAIDGVDETALPAKIRLRMTLRDEADLAPGEVIAIRAVLRPPPEPAAPGAFDFARQAYFQRLGAVGYAVGHAEVLQAGANGEPGLLERWQLWWASLRAAIAARVLDQVPGDTGAVASALMTGERGAISEPTMEAIRASGLAHLLAISGLHMGLVAGLVFFGVRALLALYPALALRQPIKKWAAAAAILAAFCYLFLVGATIPTQRAFLMIGVVLVAVLLDRAAVSLRLVAWAALVVLALAPESLLHAGFQMSFAAVTALVAGYEVLAQRSLRRAVDDGVPRRLLIYLVGVTLTSVIAILATAPFAAYHFNRLALYGLAANLFAVPMTAFWIMPWALIAYLLMPLGLDGPALQAMAWGVSAVIAVARTVSAWPGALFLVGTVTTLGFTLIVAGGLWLCLWRRPWRLAGLAVIALGLLAAGASKPPDVLVSGDGKLMALRGADGGLWINTLRGGGFTRDSWLRRAGSDLARPWPGAGKALDGRLSCDPLGCLYRDRGEIVSLVRDPRALDEDCRVATLLVATVPLRRWQCPRPARLLDRFDLWREGAHALWLTGNGVHVESVAQRRGDRPWVQVRGGN
ncbi:MAG: ComEC/Rec2 family competence protein [Pseudomonadota bacterium]